MCDSYRFGIDSHCDHNWCLHCWQISGLGSASRLKAMSPLLAGATLVLLWATRYSYLVVTLWAGKSPIWSYSTQVMNALNRTSHDFFLCSDIHSSIRWSSVMICLVTVLDIFNIDYNFCCDLKIELKAERKIKCFDFMAVMTILTNWNELYL